MAEWNGTGEEQGEGSPASDRSDPPSAPASASAPETQPTDDPGR